LLGYARLSGGVLARAHVRTSNGAVLSGYIGGGDAGPEALAKFSMRYADQTEKDHADFVKGIRVERKVAAPKKSKLRKEGKAFVKALTKKAVVKKVPTKKKPAAKRTVARKPAAKKSPTRKAARSRRAKR
jgi:hypothetical protein